MEITTEKTKNPNNSINGIDVGKLLCSILVVFTHTNPLNSFSSILNFGICNYLTRIAVPFFFISTGYLLFRTTTYINLDIYRIKVYIFKIIRLYILWSMIYFPIQLSFIIRNHPKGYIHSFLIYFRDFLLQGSYTHLWYLLATIVAVIIVSYLVCKKMNLQKLFIISLLLYFIGLLGQSYLRLLEPLRGSLIWRFLIIVRKFIGTTRNGLFFGFLFVLIGVLSAWNPVEISFKKATVCFALSMLLLLIEIFLLHKAGWDRAYDMFIFLIPSAYYFFQMALRVPLPENTSLYVHYRKLSSLIFFGHLWIRRIVGKIYILLSELFSVELNNSLLLAFSTLIITILCSELIIWMSQKKHLKWLKYIYS